MRPDILMVEQDSNVLPLGQVVGPEDLIAGIDCGFQVHEGDSQVDGRVS